MAVTRGTVFFIDLFRSTMSTRSEFTAPNLLFGESTGFHRLLWLKRPYSASVRNWGTTKTARVTSRRLRLQYPFNMNNCVRCDANDSRWVARFMRSSISDGCWSHAPATNYYWPYLSQYAPPVARHPLWLEAYRPPSDLIRKVESNKFLKILCIFLLSVMNNKYFFVFLFNSLYNLFLFVTFLSYLFLILLI